MCPDASHAATTIIVRVSTLKADLLDGKSPKDYLTKG